MKVTLKVLDELAITVYNDGSEGVNLDISDSEWARTKGQVDTMGFSLSATEADLLVYTLEWAKREMITCMTEEALNT